MDEEIKIGDIAYVVVEDYAKNQEPLIREGIVEQIDDGFLFSVRFTDKRSSKVSDVFCEEELGHTADEAIEKYLYEKKVGLIEQAQYHNYVWMK